MDTKTLKNLIRNFVNESHKNSFSSNDRKDPFLLNFSIFDIENYLVDLRNDLEVNTRLDSTISSKNIIANFKNPAASASFKPIDHQFTFLHHIIITFKQEDTLYELVDSYISRYKESFTVADIVMTKSGATRCKTNLRFAIDALRDLGLITILETGGKRSWSPTLGGLLIMLYNNIENKYPGSESTLKKLKPPYGSVPLNKSRSGKTFFSKYNFELLGLIELFTKKDHSLSFFDQIQQDIENMNPINPMNELAKAFIRFVETDFTDQSGLPKLESFKKLPDNFKQSLTKLNKNIPVIREAVWEHYRSLFPVDGEK